MSKGGVGAEIILSAVMEGGGSGNKVSTSASWASSLPSKHLRPVKEMFTCAKIKPKKMNEIIWKL